MTPTTKSAAKESGGAFSDAERSAMKATAAERRAAAKGAKAEDDVKAVLDAIARMTDEDRELCGRLHEIITAAGPDLAPRSWYGMPAYAMVGKVIVAVKNSG